MSSAPPSAPSLATVRDAVELLASLDVTALPAQEALELAVAARRAEAAAAGLGLAALGRLSDTYPRPERPWRDRTEEELRRRNLVSEVRAAFGISAQAAGTHLHDAAMAGADHLASTAALREGSLDRVSAWRIREATRTLSPEARRAVDEAVTARHAATVHGLTSRQLGEVLGREVVAADPGAAARAVDDAVKARRVWRCRDGVAGGTLGASGPVSATEAAYAAVDAAARAARRSGAAGTLDELRFALLTGALQGLVGGPASPPAEPAAPTEPPQPTEASQPTEAPRSSPGAAPATPDAGSCVEVVLNLTMPITTLLGLDDAPALLDGVGAIPADLGRDLAGAARTWRRLLTDPVDGHVVTQVVRSYPATEAMRALVRARAGGVCASRGCGNRVGLQLDHVVPHADGGPTSATNLCPLCSGCHDGKTCGAWTHVLDAVTGELIQVSPLGLAYRTGPLPPPGSTGQRAGPLDPRLISPHPQEDPDDTIGPPPEPADLHDPAADPPDPWPALEARARQRRQAFIAQWVAGALAGPDGPSSPDRQTAALLEQLAAEQYDDVRADDAEELSWAACSETA